MIRQRRPGEYVRPLMQDVRMAHYQQPDSSRHVSDVAVSLIRTWVPIGAGSILAWLATSQHIAIPADVSATVGVFLAAACSAAYYAIARAAEQTHGTNIISRLVRFIGRYMLGGIVAKPTYIDAADYDRLQAKLRLNDEWQQHPKTPGPILP